MGVDRKLAGFGEPDLLNAFSRALDQLTRLGAQLSDVTLPEQDLMLKTYYATGNPEYTIANSELYRQHEQAVGWYLKHPTLNP